jgi:alpha-ketoglutarate-dependent taurine dioxygenase
MFWEDVMALAEQTRLKVEAIKPMIGARVLTDKQALLSGEHAAELMDVLEQRGVLVFPQVNFTDEEQIAFTNTLGKFTKEIRGADVYKVSLDPTVTATAEYLKGAFFWHFDGSMSPAPVRASILSAKVLSPTGGDTDFCNTYAAFEDLPDAEKKELEGLRAVHANTSAQLYVEPEPSVEQWMGWKSIGVGRKELPLVWTHRSGRKSLVIGNTAHHVVGMDPLDGKELLIRLRDWATQPQFSYRHKWTVGDAVMWDNTGTLHRATSYPLDCGRLLHRTKLEGDEPIVA